MMFSSRIIRICQPMVILCRNPCLSPFCFHFLPPNLLNLVTPCRRKKQRCSLPNMKMLLFLPGDSFANSLALQDMKVPVLCNQSLEQRTDLAARLSVVLAKYDAHSAMLTHKAQKNDRFFVLLSTVFPISRNAGGRLTKRLLCCQH